MYTNRPYLCFMLLLNYSSFLECDKHFINMTCMFVTGNVKVYWIAIEIILNASNDF